MGGVILLIFAVICSLLGLAGSVLPVLPGVSLSFLAIIILYSLKPGLISVSALIFFGILAVVAILSDYVFPAASAKKFGASKYGILGLVAGMILGFIIFSFVGMIMGAVVGVILGELSGGRSSEKAMYSGFAAIKGALFAILIKLSISLAMTIYFFIKIIFYTNQI